MSITLSQLEFLTSSRGDILLQELAEEDVSEKNTLALLTRLRKTYTPDESRAALTMAQLQQKATAKFGDIASRLFFTEDALQQASDILISQYRATQVEGSSVLDVCCSIGSDAISFASAGKQVLGLDIDPVRIAIAEHNANVLDCDARFEVADVTQGIPDDYSCIFFDPARRNEQGKRIFHVEQYQPPLSLIQQWRAPQIIVKLSPGVQLDQLTGYSGTVEFVSVEGALKEAVLHTNRSGQSYKATLIADGLLYHWQRQVDYQPEVEIREPAGWLVEPDPAIIRAGLVEDVAVSMQGHMLDETIAYFTTSIKPESVWVRSWQIIDWMPFQLKKLRAYLRERNVGQVTVKKRGFAMQPEELIPKLKLKGSEGRTLIITRYQGKPIVIICSNLS